MASSSKSPEKSLQINLARLRAMEDTPSSGSSVRTPLEIGRFAHRLSSAAAMEAEKEKDDRYLYVGGLGINQSCGDEG